MCFLQALRVTEDPLPRLLDAGHPQELRGLRAVAGRPDPVQGESAVTPLNQTEQEECHVNASALAAVLRERHRLLEARQDGGRHRPHQTQRVQCDHPGPLRLQPV